VIAGNSQITISFLLLALIDSWALWLS